MLAIDVKYTGDHAAWGETSLMMHLYPDTVTSHGWRAPSQGRRRARPRESSAEDGRLIAEIIVARLATLAKNMPAWDQKKLDRFIDAEAALSPGSSRRRGARAPSGRVAQYRQRDARLWQVPSRGGLRADQGFCREAVRFHYWRSKQ